MRLIVHVSASVTEKNVHKTVCMRRPPGGSQTSNKLHFKICQNSHWIQSTQNVPTDQLVNAPALHVVSPANDIARVLICSKEHSATAQCQTSWRQTAYWTPQPHPHTLHPPHQASSNKVATLLHCPGPHPPKDAPDSTHRGAWAGRLADPLDRGDAALTSDNG